MPFRMPNGCFDSSLGAFPELSATLQGIRPMSYALKRLCPLPAHSPAEEGIRLAGSIVIHRL